MAGPTPPAIDFTGEQIRCAFLTAVKYISEHEAVTF